MRQLIAVIALLLTGSSTAKAQAPSSQPVATQPQKPAPPAAVQPVAAVAAMPQRPTSSEVAMQPTLRGSSTELFVQRQAQRQQLGALGRYIHYGDKDSYSQFEAYYAYHFAGIIHALRFGAGGMIGQTLVPTYYGEAEPLEEAESFRFYYGEVAIELDFNRWLGFVTSVKLGVNDEGVGGGWLGGLRIGPAEGVNVQVGGQLLSYIGSQGFLSLRVPAGEWLTVGPQVVVEETPLANELGFRCSLQAEARLGRWLGLTAEIGGAARDVKHGGLTGGLGLVSYF